MVRPINAPNKDYLLYVYKPCEFVQAEMDWGKEEEARYILIFTTTFNYHFSLWIITILLVQRKKNGIGVEI